MDEMRRQLERSMSLSHFRYVPTNVVMHHKSKSMLKKKFKKCEFETCKKCFNHLNISRTLGLLSIKFCTLNFAMSSNNVHSMFDCVGFPFPLERDVHSTATLSMISSLFLDTTPCTNKAPKLHGKVHKPSVDGNLSIANILSNAFLLSGFPRSSYAVTQAGKLGLTFNQLDTISKRLALMISSLAILPESGHQVRKNNDGDSVVMLILDDEDYADEKLITLIFAILRLGATYMAVCRNQLTDSLKEWTELVQLIEPILVVTMSDPIDLPTAIKQDLNLITLDHFEDFPEEDDLNSISNADSENEEGSTTEASNLLVKKIRSSLILNPSMDSTAPTVSCKFLWDLAMELDIRNEQDLQILHFQSDASMGQRTAFIHRCTCTSPHSSPVQRWCRLGHKAIRNRISWERMEFPITATEKLCLTFPLHDPRSLVQIFNCFIHGKALLLGEPGEFQSGPFLLRKFSSDVFKHVQRIELTPGRLLSLLECVVQPKLRLLLAQIKIWIVSTSSVTPFTYSLAKRFFQTANSNQVKLVVTYGTAECLWCITWNMFSSMNEVHKRMLLEEDGNCKPFAGFPMTNSNVVVMDDRKSVLCPLGQKGQICLLGSMVPLFGYCGSPILGRPITVFQTGGIGQLLQDKGGDLQLIVETPEEINPPRQKVMIKGKLVDLDGLSKFVKENSLLVREAFAFICQRGGDTPEIVIAIALKDPAQFETVRESMSSKLREIAPPVTFFPMPGNVIPKISLSGQDNYEMPGPVDLKALRAAYFQFLGKCSSRNWLSLIPMKGIGKAKNMTDEAIEKTIKIICKAVAFSLGTSLSYVIDNFYKSFWELGGSPIRAIMMVKSCLCQGKNMGIEDFMIAETISELGFRLVYAENNDTKWFHEIELVRQFFIYSRLTRSDHLKIHDILIANFSKILPSTEQKMIDKCSSDLIQTFDNSLSAVALSAENREMLGVSLNYRGNLTQLCVPTELEEGLELYNVMLQSCRHLTAGIENKNIAKSYIISLKTEALAHPSQLLLILRDLVRESMGYAESVGCKGFMVCSQDALVQEVCCNLLGFEVLTEIQLNMYRNKKFQTPFAHLDDHQVIGVYFAKLNV